MSSSSRRSVTRSEGGKTFTLTTEVVVSLTVFAATFGICFLIIIFCYIVKKRREGKEKAIEKREPNEYFESMKRRQGPVQSISQYRKKPVQSPRKPGPRPSPRKPGPRPSPSKPLPTRTPTAAAKKGSDESTGSEYFNQINRTNVRSISQYAALKK